MRQKPVPIHTRMDKENYNMNEAEFYKYLFAENFSSYKPDIDLWLPKLTNTNNELSANVLKIYKI